MKNYYFIGILGSGMSALARILFEMGNKVGGSDRNTSTPLFGEFKSIGINVYPQDGSGISSFSKDINCGVKDVIVVKSTAIEDTVPDIVEARKHGLCELHRSDALAGIFNERYGIAIAGTAGKTSVSTMASYLLDALKKSPSFVIGGVSRNFNASSRFGASDYFVIESDESDGTIVKYKSEIGVLTNISREHKELPELFELFNVFIDNIKKGGKTVINLSCPNAFNLYKSRLEAGKKDDFRTVNFDDARIAADIKPDFSVTEIVLRPYGSVFKLNGTVFETSLIGRHNVENLALAIVAVHLTGAELKDIAGVLRGYGGVARRMEVVGKYKDVVIIDDYAHNPHEIKCAIDAVKVFNKPVIAVYQPHGFGPTSFTRHDLCSAFNSLGEDDAAFITEIYYAGGTVNRDVSSSEIVDEMKEKSGVKDVFYTPDLDALTDALSRFITRSPEKSYIALVMGARNVNTVCPRVLEAISRNPAVQAKK